MFDILCFFLSFSRLGKWRLQERWPISKEGKIEKSGVRIYKEGGKTPKETIFYFKLLKWDEFNAEDDG